jgi:hypothetical protein
LDKGSTAKVVYNDERISGGRIPFRYRFTSNYVVMLLREVQERIALAP